MRCSFELVSTPARFRFCSSEAEVASKLTSKEAHRTIVPGIQPLLDGVGFGYRCAVEAV